jgi:nucleoside-diphosphate-sugar epimerase
MNPSSATYVAGHRVLVGSALVCRLKAGCHRNLLNRTRAELDLQHAVAIRRFFEQGKPEYVFLTAAKVGGILANNANPSQFFAENLAIQTNVMHEAYMAGVKRLLFLGASCICPRDCPRPIKEEYLHTRPLEATNRPYAIAKIAGIEMCWSYNRQCGTRYPSVMPTNLYGPGDNYDLKSFSVLPALIRKMHEAKGGRRRSYRLGNGHAKKRVPLQCLHGRCVRDVEESARYARRRSSGRVPAAADQCWLRQGLHQSRTLRNAGEGGVVRAEARARPE